MPPCQQEVPDSTPSLLDAQELRADSAVGAHSRTGRLRVKDYRDQGRGLCGGRRATQAVGHVGCHIHDVDLPAAISDRDGQGRVELASKMESSDGCLDDRVQPGGSGKGWKVMLWWRMVSVASDAATAPAISSQVARSRRTKPEHGVTPANAVFLDVFSNPFLKPSETQLFLSGGTI